MPLLMTSEQRDTTLSEAVADRHSARLKAEAAVWVVRLDAERVQQDDPRLQRWLARSDAHRHALAAALQTWKLADARYARNSEAQHTQQAKSTTLAPTHAQPNTAATRPLIDRPKPSRIDASPRTQTDRAAGWKRFIPQGIKVPTFAFALALLLAVSVTKLANKPDWSTSTGETRTIALADGSSMTLDAQSAADVRFTPTQRQIVLRKGRAAFTVAHGDTRPFVVAAREGAIQDIGTVFQVDRLDNGQDGQAPLVNVTVIGGRVRVTTAGGSEILSANQASTYRGSDSPERLQEVDLAAVTAWQKGRLRFSDMPLADVLHALNRYYPGHYVVAYGDAAALHVSGNFNLAEPERALNALNDAFGLTQTEVAGRLIVLSKK